jgi:hypothetical protein
MDMRCKGMGIFLALSLLSIGLLANCKSQPKPESPAGPAVSEPEPVPEPPAGVEDSSLRLLTKKLLDRAYNRDHLDPKKFQYFLSEAMTMERGRNTSSLSLNTKGELSQEESRIREEITLKKETMGVAKDIRIGEDYRHWEIDVRFNPPDDRILTFRENNDGNSFDLLYVQTQTGKKISYGDDEYDLGFEEIPQLMIRMIENSRDQMVVTVAEGIPVDSLPPPAP